MARFNLTRLQPVMRDGIWLFLGMAAYGPRWWALAALACWCAHAYCAWRT